MPVLEEFGLKGRVALIAGNGRGWTPVLAQALAEAGASVGVVAYRLQDVEVAKAALKGLRAPFWGKAVNLASPREVRQGLEELAQVLGTPSILVNNLQAQVAKDIITTSLREWQRLMRLNSQSTMVMCKEVGRLMLSAGGGKVINLASITGLRGVGNSVAYGATQGAVLHLTRSLAMEWARRGIQVNAIACGWFNGDPISVPHEKDDPFVLMIPSRRLGEPEDVGPLLVYLSCSASDYITGQVFVLDGGATARL